MNRGTRPRRARVPAHGGPRVYFLRHAQTLVGSLGRLSRQPFATAMTIAVIGVALALPAGLHVTVLNAKQLSARWESVADLSVYLVPGTDDQALAGLADRIRDREDVAGVETVSADQALVEFRALSGFGDALDALDDNPLPPLIVVRPQAGGDDAESVASLAEALRAEDGVDLVQSDTAWVERFDAIVDVVRRTVLLAAGLLALAVVVIVGNTIRLDIQNRRDEIEITRLVGASDGFVRRPFLYTGFWYGLAGGLCALALVHIGLVLVTGPVTRISGLYGSDFRLAGPGAMATAALVAGGALLGWLGSWAAATRHMLRIDPN